MIDSQDLSLRPRRSFEVSDVERTNHRLSLVDYGKALGERVLQRGDILEAYSRDTSMLVSPQGHNAFIEAAKLAYSYHRPLIISPDMVWLQITQGFAQHVGLHAEELRSKFVNQAGKLKLIVYRDEFVRGFAGNDWEGVIGEFSAQIRSHVGDKVHDLVAQKFSTTSNVERAAFEVTLLDAMQHYFEYEVLCICGIPEITLEGTVDDWKTIRAYATRFSAFGLGWWVDHLLPVLDQFIAARQGQVDLSFWRSYYRVDGGCGPDVNGHILKFVPYLINYGRPTPGEWRLRSSGLRRNPVFDERSAGSTYGGVGSRSIPPGLSVAPFTITYGITKILMEFVAGFVGVRQDPETLALRPEIGWAVVEKSSTA